MTPELAAPPDCLSVLVVDDHAVFAEALGLALDAGPGTRCAGVAHGVTDALRLAERTPFDVAIVDHHLPGESGLRLVGPLLETRPAARVVMLTAYPRADLAADALAAGAAAFLAKESPLAEIVAAVRDATPERPVVAALAEPPGHGGLTPREHEVLRLLAQGHDARHIARTCGLSIHTVRDHIKAVLAKLQARTQLEAVVTAARRGLVDLEQV
ncbi:response regulator transcription factor [Jiangella alkaliphila]|uniref:DNA-binding response regulator, NarL/FixJ family, contains REC and HTH domains n=1 Tax=Jiangella alkaliphila TaxID=419479 RepID=A0A1H2LCM7_9ACTN|nr:response regulator transcription factor [Jiangella alkaliphila]SDU78592.1 DNA-binding response regulator, NarL/FixJ family, contains REC and HTH domains [Jiangella alkaliphila]